MRGPLQRAHHNGKARAPDGVASRIWPRLRHEMPSCEAQIRGLWSARPTVTMMFPFPGLHGRIVAALVTRTWWPFQLPVSARSDLPSARLSCSVLVRFWWQSCQFGRLGSLCWTPAASLWQVTFCAAFLEKSLGWPVPCLQAGQEERGVHRCLHLVQPGQSELGWASVIPHLQGVSGGFLQLVLSPSARRSSGWSGHGCKRRTLPEVGLQQTSRGVELQMSSLKPCQRWNLARTSPFPVRRPDIASLPWWSERPCLRIRSPHVHVCQISPPKRFWWHLDSSQMPGLFLPERPTSHGGFRGTHQKRRHRRTRPACFPPVQLTAFESAGW